MGIVIIEIQQDKVLLYMALKICEKPISFKVNLLSWSNEKQKLVPLKESTVKEFLSLKKYDEFILKYEKVANSFLKYISSTITTHKSLEKLKKRLHPTYIFHPNLLKEFSKKELENIMDTHFKLYPILDIENFDCFLANKINGWFIADIMEVDVTKDGVYICDISGDKPKSLSIVDTLRILKIK